MNHPNLTANDSGAGRPLRGDNKLRSERRLRTFIGWLPLFLIVLLPGSQAAGASDDAAARRTRIQSLSAFQKERLARNFEAFQKLPPAEQDQYRKLDVDLKADHSGELGRIMLQYHEWLKTLDLNQRDQLRNEKDPQRRQELVYRFRNEQEQRRELASMTRREDASGRMGEQRGLSSDDLSNVMRVIEFHLRSGMAISEEQDAELAKVKGVERYRMLLGILAKAMAESPSSTKIEFNEIVAAIKDREQRDFIQSRPQATIQRTLTIMLIIKGLIDQLRLEVSEQGGEEILNRFFETLSTEHKDEVQKLSKDQRTQRLIGLYMESMFQMFRRGVFSGMRPFGRPGSFSGGDRFRGGGGGRRGPGRFRPQRGDGPPPERRPEEEGPPKNGPSNFEPRPERRPGS